jgi:AraC family transcriptional regulator
MLWPSNMTDIPPEEHLHLIDSFSYGWQKLNLIYEHEPAGEMPAGELPGHMIVVAQGDFHGSFEQDGRWQHRHYHKGDVMIVPASEWLPRTLIDREVPLIELFLNPCILDRQGPTALEIQLQVRDPLIEQMGLALQQEVLIMGQAGREYADAMAIALSSHVARRYGKRQILAPTGQFSQAQRRSIDDYIQSHLAEDLTVDRLAQLIQLSPGHFATLFRRTFGRTPHQYVIQQRIAVACRLLQQSELPISIIVNQVGLQINPVEPNRIEPDRRNRLFFQRNRQQFQRPITDADL